MSSVTVHLWVCISLILKSYITFLVKHVSPSALNCVITLAVVFIASEDRIVHCESDFHGYILFLFLVNFFSAFHIQHDASVSGSPKIHPFELISLYLDFFLSFINGFLDIWLIPQDWQLFHHYSLLLRLFILVISLVLLRISVSISKLYNMLYLISVRYSPYTQLACLIKCLSEYIFILLCCFIFPLLFRLHNL